MRGWPAAGLVSAALAAAPGAAQAQGPPQASFPVGLVNARETDADVRVAVDLSQADDEPVRVDWSAGPPYMIADASGALEGRDYADGRGTLEFAPGDTREEIVLRLLDDGIYEGGAMLALTLDTGRQPPEPFAVVDIRDDETQPTVSIGDVVVPESAGVAALRVIRSWPSTFSERYGWTTAAGTAAGADFVTRSGELALYYLATATEELRVPIEQDTADEPDETFEVWLTALPPLSPWGSVTGLVADGVATVTIVDDDPPRPAVPALTAAVARGRVFLRQRGAPRRRLTGDVPLPRGAVLDLRRGAARLRFAGGAATLAGGIVKVRGMERLALAGGCRRHLTVTADPGLVIAARRAATSATGGPARWAITDRCDSTRVGVRRGKVRVAARGGRSGELGPGRRRTYR